MNAPILYYRSGRALWWLGLPLIPLLLLDAFWPGNAPLWLGMILVPLLLVDIFVLTPIWVISGFIVCRRRRALRKNQVG